jgi:hypothetical protein
MARYRAALNELRVTDPWGRLWMPQEHTGQWHVYQNGQWVPAAPPVTPPPPPAQVSYPQAYPPQQGQQAYYPQAAPQAYPPQQSQQAYHVQPAPQAYQQQRAQPYPAQKQDSVGCLKPLLTFALGGVIWIIIAVVGYFIWGREAPRVLLGGGLAALLSFVLLAFSMLQNWKGQVVDIRTERIRVDDSDGDWHWEQRTYAYIRMTNGRTARRAGCPTGRSATGWRSAAARPTSASCKPLSCHR